MFFFRSKTKPQEPTLKQRVAGFWEWFAANADRIDAAIEENRCADMQPETSGAVDNWLGGMAWVYGPGESGNGHSLTLSGEGSLAKQFVAEYCVSQAPELARWVFHSSRQPSIWDGGKFVLRLDDGGEEFNAIEFWVTPNVNDEREELDIFVWHPSIARLPEGTCMSALFLTLDELLGEHGTQNWIGEIKFTGEHLENSIPITELPEWIANLERDHGWKKFPPTETYSNYRLKTEEYSWPRGDTVVGTSRFFDLVGDYLDAKGPCEHPFPGIGVDYVFVSIPTSFFPQGEAVNGRGVIEDEIIEALESAAAGISLGGATGRQNCYMDFAIYDGERSIEIIRDVLRKRNAPKQTTIRFFTIDRGKEVHRV